MKDSVAVSPTAPQGANKALMLTDAVMSSIEFKEFLKKMKEDSGFTFFTFQNVSFSLDNCNALFSGLKRSHHLDAVDFSRNALSTPFEAEITDFLRVCFNTSYYNIF